MASTPAYIAQPGSAHPPERTSWSSTPVPPATDSATAAKASAETVPELVVRLTATVWSTESRPSGTWAVTSTWRSSASASAAKVRVSASLVAGITWPPPAAARVVRSSAGRSTRDTTSRRICAASTAAVTVSSVVSVVSAPSESTTSVRCPSVPATSTALRTPS